MNKIAAAVALFAAAVCAAADPDARLVLHMAPGFEVLVDGVSFGPTTAQEGGRLLRIAPGTHHVVVRSAEGREGAFDVSLAAGETREVTLSPLGLRKKIASDNTGELRVVCVPEDCTVDFKPAATAVPPGRYPLLVNRGGKSLRMDVDIPENTVVTVEANFTAGTIRAIDARRRSRKLDVAEPNDALRNLPVPAYWKSAIRSALPSGVVMESASAEADGVRVTLRIPSADVARSMLIAIMQSHAFSDVQAPSSPRQERGGWLFDIDFSFPEK